MQRRVYEAAADLGRVTPACILAWREDDVTLAEALNDPDFGEHVPVGSQARVTYTLVP
ncbi:MAG TPA: hypothetical protein GX716_01010 [Firmicutes bacterium]|nr:hypothetical protein [Candidatus Fermentithermobacillaceae bacterium]